MQAVALAIIARLSVPIFYDLNFMTIIFICMSGLTARHLRAIYFFSDHPFRVFSL